MDECTPDYWDRHAAGFDDSPDHGLTTPEVRRAWLSLLLGVLPPAPATVLDLGCGTGSLSVLLAEAGHAVHGLDFSAQMVAAARAKAAAAGVDVEFRQGDAGLPPYPSGAYDVVLARHLLWVLPEPETAVAEWVRLLRPSGRLLLVEGRWGTGAGVSATDCTALVHMQGREAQVVELTEEALWGGPVHDERYLLISAR